MNLGNELELIMSYSLFASHLSEKRLHLCAFVVGEFQREQPSKAERKRTHQM
jgi:hypothetical protein